MLNNFLHISTKWRFANIRRMDEVGLNYLVAVQRYVKDKTPEWIELGPRVFLVTFEFNISSVRERMCYFFYNLNLTSSTLDFPQFFKLREIVFHTSNKVTSLSACSNYLFV